MMWNTVHDEMLCREILVVDPFTWTKKRTVERGTEQEEVAENLNKIQRVYFEVDKRAGRDRYNLLSKELRNKHQELTNVRLYKVQLLACTANCTAGTTLAIT